MATLPSKTTTSNRFEDFLLQHGFINKAGFDDLKKKLLESAKAGRNNSQSTFAAVNQIVSSQRLLDEESLAKAKAAFLNLPYIDIRNRTIEASVLNIIPVESRNFYGLVPFEVDGTAVKVATADPTNLQALEALEFLGQKQNLQINLYVASGVAIAAATKQKNLLNVVGAAVEDFQQKEAKQQRPIAEAQGGKQHVLEDAPIIKIVDVILSNAIEADASDIHIEPSENDVRVRYRIDGILHTSLRLPKNILPAIISRVKILSNLKIDEQRLPQDGRFHVDMVGKSVDLRVSTLPVMYGEKVVMRILDKSTTVPTLEQLGLDGRGLSWVTDNIKKNHGIFLITGPTGSGKSTTLYALLSMLNTTAVNIITLEDPVEYFIPGINQSQIKPEIGLTFASGLRSILRQDPNIIMVGEIRDEETAELAVHAALTGHLVFSTLHTNNSVGAIPRLINMGIEPFLLSASLNMVMGQRLVRRLCPHCRKPTAISDITRAEIKKDLIGIPDDYLKGLDPAHPKIFVAQGCEQCGHTGYKGRFGIFEVLPVTTELQELVYSKTPGSKIYEQALKFGVITMKQDGIIKVLRGETTMDEIIRVTTE